MLEVPSRRTEICAQSSASSFKPSEVAAKLAERRHHQCGAAEQVIGLGERGFQGRHGEASVEQGPKSLRGRVLDCDKSNEASARPLRVRRGAG